MKRTLITLLTVGLLGTASSAFATTFTGTSTGCLTTSASCTPAASSTIMDSNGGSSLTFTGMPFGPTSGGPGIVIGSFTLTNTATGGNYNNGGSGDTFDLTVSFTSPPGASNGTYMASVSGTIMSLGSSVILDVASPLRETIDASGDYILLSPSYTLAPGSTNLTATLGTPEPLSVGLLGGGLALLGIARWRRSAKKG